MEIIIASFYRELLVRTGNNQIKAAQLVETLEEEPLNRKTLNNRIISISKRLKKYKIEFEDIPPLTDLVKQFPQKNTQNKEAKLKK